MIYNNEQQLLKVEDELFNLALLGLLEIEGRKLIEEKEQMVQRGEYASPPAGQLRRIEKMIRQGERKKVFQSSIRKISPVISKVAVWFMVFIMGTGTVVFASADIREALYRLIVEQHERYSQIELQQGEENRAEYISNAASYVPSYVPDQMELDQIEKLRYSVNASYIGKDNAELYLTFRQIDPTGSAEIRVDTEDANRIESVAIGSSEGLLVEKDGSIQIVWNADGTVLTVISNLNKEEVLRFAQGIQTP